MADSKEQIKQKIGIEEVNKEVEFQYAVLCQMIDRNIPAENTRMLLKKAIQEYGENQKTASMLETYYSTSNDILENLQKTFDKAHIEHIKNTQKMLRIKPEDSPLKQFKTVDKR